ANLVTGSGGSVTGVRGPIYADSDTWWHVAWDGGSTGWVPVSSLAGGPPPNPPSITTSSLPGGQAGTSYSTTTLAASGGTAPYSNWVVSSGALPPGLALNLSSGTISGTPTTDTGSPFNFSVTVKDNVGSTSAAKPLSITILPAPPPAGPSIVTS